MSAESCFMQWGPEAHQTIKDLKPFEVTEIGTKAWMKQQDAIQRLNAEAHRQVVSQTEEWVMQTLVDESKIEVLIHELIAIEIWRERVFPHLKERAAKHDFLRMKVYMILFHEANIVNLLEVIMFHKSVIGALGELGLELVDYCYRRLIHLSAMDNLEDFVKKPTSAEQLDKQTDIQELERQCRTITFNCSIGAIALVRYMAEHAEAMPLGSLSRLLNQNDVILPLVEILANKPWRVRFQKKWYIFEDGSWKEVDRDELQRIRKVEGQLWIALTYLLLDRECRSRYEYTEQKKQIILQIRNNLTEITIDQLPVLADLRRYLDELSLMPAPEATAAKSFLLEQVPETRDRLLASVRDWKKFAEDVISAFEKQSDSDRKEEIDRLANLIGSAGFEDLLDEPKCEVCGKDAEKRCSRCKSAWYCSRECQLAGWKKHKAFCQVLSQQN